MNSPTRASSEAPGHSARLANDGNPATFWQADAGDTNAWLQVDLERIVTVSKTKLTFPTRQLALQNRDFRRRRNGWKLFADQTQTPGPGKERTDTAQTSSVRGRFLRVMAITNPEGGPAALAELEVQGVLSAQ